MKAERAAKITTGVVLTFVFILGMVLLALTIGGVFSSSSCDNTDPFSDCTPTSNTASLVGYGLWAFEGLLLSLVATFWFYVWIIRTAIGERL